MLFWLRDLWSKTIALLIRMLIYSHAADSNTYRIVVSRVNIPHIGRRILAYFVTSLLFYLLARSSAAAMHTAIERE